MDGGLLPAPISPSEALAARPLNLPRPGSKAAQAHQAAQDFEAVYLAAMLQPMFDSVEIDPTFGGGNAEETWRSMQVEEMARQISRSGGIGLATTVEQEMLRLQEVADGNAQHAR